MGLFDKVKEANKQRQDKKAELKKVRGQFLAAFAQLEYMGGYGDRHKSLGSLWFFENQVEFKVVVTKNPKLSFIIPTTDIADVAVEGKDEVSRRVTVTRLLAVGIFAFALKKKSEDKETFVTIVLKDGQEIIFHVDNKAPMDVKASLSKVLAYVRQNAAPKVVSVAAPASVADELTKLTKLKQAGVITQAEFDKKKAELLA